MILHVATGLAWGDQGGRDYFSPDAFLKEGFIHCCSEAQLHGVLERYFSGHQALILLHIDETKLIVPLRYEAATNGEMFPHIYGVINKDANIRISKL